MNEVKTFRADSVQEALDMIRADLGSDAVILHTRQLSRRRLLPWKKRKEEVEVTAGLGINIRPQGLRRRSETTAPAAEKAKAPHSRTVALPTAGDAGKEQGGTHEQTPPGQPFEQTSSDGDVVSLSAASTAGQRTTPRVDSPAAGDFAGKLDSIQKMLEDLGRTGVGRRTEEIPNELFHLYTELIDAEVEDDLARELITRLKQHATPAQLNDHAAARALLAGMVEAEVRCCGPIAPVQGKRKVVALVGATGVGKTTTIAKLAANLRLRDGVKMGLVTVDTYRIAAVEQLRTYAEIIDLPMKVVTNPLEMRRALDELVGLDLVLIDTAGRSPRDELQIQELKRLLAEARVDEVHLVLSMTSSMRSNEKTAEKFAAANTTSLIVTKLDEAASMGTLLSIARKVSLPISYITTGQDVPDDIESVRPARIARLVLGEDKLFD